MGALTNLLPANTYGDLLQANNANGGVPASTLQQFQDGFGNGTALWLSQAALGIAADVAFTRIAAGVLGVTGAVLTAGWMQNTAGEGALASAFTDATGTLAATTLSFSVVAGRSYRIDGCFQISNSTAADGFQCDFNGGSATATTFFMAANGIGSLVTGAVTSASLAGVINYTTVTGTDYVFLNGYLKVNAGGTFVVRAASNTHVAGTMTLGAGSWLALHDTVRL